MDEIVTPEKRPQPKIVLYFGVFTAVFTVLPTIQTIGLGLLLGFSSELFLIRLWSTCFLWLAPATAALVMTPLFLPGDRTLLVRVRVVSAVVTVIALGLLAWQGFTGRMPLAMLPVGLFISLSGWSGTFLVKARQSESEPAR